jgi:RNA polymerase sigma-70 factor (ECF subfamily)
MNSASGPLTSVTLLGRLRHLPADPGAWQEFIDCYGPKIYHWCLRSGLQEADAEDLTQTILLKLLRVMHTFEYDPTLRFRNWLRTVVQNAWNDLLRTLERTRALTGTMGKTDPLDTLEARDDLVTQLEAAYDRELLELAASRVRLRIAPQTWDVYRLSAIEQLPVNDVAARLNMKVAAVYKARNNVQKYLRDEVKYLEGEE